MKTDDIRNKCASLLAELFSRKGYMHHILTGHMQKEWDAVNKQDAVNLADQERIWTKIQQKINEPLHLHNLLFYYRSFSIVASVLLIVAMGGFVYLMNQEKKPTMYVLKTGVRSMHELMLADGTRVILGPNSELVYPGAFVQKKRDVKLIGQAYFEVAKDKQKPFTVHTSEMDVTALGTAFEIFDYADRGVVETILKEGKVKVLYPTSLQNKRHTQETVLTPNQKFSHNTITLKNEITAIDAEVSTKWQKKGHLCFEKRALKEILPRLEKWYGREIICQDKEILNSIFTFKVRDESLENILYLMSHSVKMSYVKRGEAYIIRNIEKK